ncbi:MAG: protein kinase, partial [Acidobacteriota bacterium]
MVLFIARAADGLTGGNVSVANAYLADITSEEDRSTNFGKLSVSTNLGFVLGPAINERELRILLPSRGYNSSRLIGETLSHFRIIAKLGEGGMGEVFRAQDTKLGREVAIKVLPETFTQDAERLARFEREAKVLASLNHPNIAGIHQVEEVDGRQILVMELVDGTDLTDRLAGRELPLDEAIRIATQIAFGLEAAHARGIVHRDLKPANIKLTPDGQVKILDFGLAKTVQAPGTEDKALALSRSPTLTAQMTQAGVILGTAGYMSPEQARGEPTDQRADIWSFGVVLYEMLTGAALFTEPTASDTLAAVLRAEVDWKRLPHDTPTRLHRLLRRCLERDPRQRLHAIADARIELEAPGDEPGIAKPISAVVASSWGMLLAAFVAGVLVTGALFFLLSGPTTDSSESNRRLKSLQVVDGVGVDFFSVQWGMNVSEPRISPDGSMVAYPSNNHLWIRDMDRLEPRALEETEGAFDAFWSRDSKELAYMVGSELRRVAARGGPSIILAELDGAYLGGTWSRADRIVVGLGGRGLVELPGRGGEPRLLLAADSESGDFDFHSPIFLGDSETLAY